VLADLNWKPPTAVPVNEALELLGRVAFTWSDEITPLVPRESMFMTVVAAMSPNAPASPMIRLRGTVALDGNVLIWSVLDTDLKAIASTIREVTSFLLFDVDCNQYQGPDKRPVSSSTAPLYGGTGPAAPGGILRVAMVIARDGAPLTLMRRPFANTPTTSILPGVALQPEVIG
jgi:hypothetical protein